MKKFIIIGAITLSVFGIFGYNAFAANTIENNNTSIQTQRQYCNLGHENCNVNHHDNYDNNYDHNYRQHCNINYNSCHNTI